MKITKLELFTVKPRWLFLKMSTDEGISGWGEPIVEGPRFHNKAMCGRAGILFDWKRSPQY